MTVVIMTVVPVTTLLRGRLMPITTLLLEMIRVVFIIIPLMEDFIVASRIGNLSHIRIRHTHEMIKEIREEFRTGFGPSGSGGNPPLVTIYTWLECFNKQKPRSFEKATTLVDAENWISHMEKIFDVMGCEDAFKTRLAVYKFEGNALAWWKAYKQAKGGDAWLVTVTWADFKKLFFLQFFPRAEQERLKREYHSIRQTSTETSTKFMQRFLRLAGFLGAAAGTEEEQAKNF
nr:zinc finger, CCHC-type, retrotransposon Gag domain protein [Tanacetum cinerariifolium]